MWRLFVDRNSSIFPSCSFFWILSILFRSNATVPAASLYNLGANCRRRIFHSASLRRSPPSHTRRFRFLRDCRLHRKTGRFVRTFAQRELARVANQIKNALFMHSCFYSVGTAHRHSSWNSQIIISAQSRIDCRLVSTHIRPVYFDVFNRLQISHIRIQCTQSQFNTTNSCGVHVCRAAANSRKI